MKRISVLVLVFSMLLLSVPFAGAAPPAQTTGGEPAILSFSTPLTNVDRSALGQRTARVPVSWDTANRPFIANLIFDQVLPDGSAVNVELPRPLPWVASTGQGMAAPILPEGQPTKITLRMRMVNMLTREVYDEKTIELPIGFGSGTSPGIGDRATITRFTTTATFLNKADLTAGTARAPVAWSVANRPVTANLYFEQVMPDGSAINVELPRENPWVASSGLGVAAPRLPAQNATSAVLRVRLIDLMDGRLYDERTLTLPIIEGTSLPPAIASFTAGATSVDVNQLAARTARIPVSWTVENRPENTNLVFEQVFSDGRAVNVELPRSNPWVPSSGNGVAAPVLELGATNVTLRVRLINLTTRATLLQRELTLPIAGSSGSVPSYVVDPAWCYTDPFLPSNGLAVGKPAHVTALVPAEGLRLFPDPYGGVPLGLLPANADVSVLEGPFCYRLNIITNMQTAYRLWRVRGAAQPGVEGWATEYVSGPTGISSYLSGVTAPAQAGAEGQGGAETSAPAEGCLFESTLSATCPASQTMVQGAIQAFEGGYMLWRGDTGAIYVLFGDDNTWTTYPDTWTEGEAVDAGEPPAGRVAPIRGFGKVWGSEALSDRLGWALSEEQGYTMTVEEYQADGNMPSLGLSLPEGGSSVLLGETWSIITADS